MTAHQTVQPAWERLTTFKPEMARHYSFTSFTSLLQWGDDLGDGKPRLATLLASYIKPNNYGGVNPNIELLLSTFVVAVVVHFIITRVFRETRITDAVCKSCACDPLKFPEGFVSTTWSHPKGQLERLDSSAPLDLPPVINDWWLTDYARNIAGQKTHNCRFVPTLGYELEEAPTTQISFSPELGRLHMHHELLHRGHEKSGTHRCPMHFKQNFHSMSDFSIQTIVGGGTPSVEFVERIQPYIHVTHTILSGFEEGSIVAVTASDAKYEELLTAFGAKMFSKHFDYVIVYTTCDRLRRKLIKHPSVRVILVTAYVSNRSLAMFRLLPAWFGPSGRRAVVINRAYTNLPSGFLWALDNHPEDTFSCPQFNYYPYNCSFFHSPCGTMPGQASFLHAFETFGWVYGADEVVLGGCGYAMAIYHTQDTLRISFRGLFQPKHTFPVAVKAVITDGHRTMTIARDSFDRRWLSHVSKIEDFMLGDRWDITPSLDGMVRGLLRAPRGCLREFSRQEYEVAFPKVIDDHLRAAATIQTQVGPIVLFTYGSHGDVIPMKAAARQLAALGFEVWFVELNTALEGKGIVAAAESQDPSKCSGPYHRAMTVVNSCPFINYAPYFLGGPNSVLYDLSPPDDVIRPMRVARHWVPNLVYRLFQKYNKPHFHVGAYDRAWWLPRSANGETFLRVIANRGETAEALWRGSSSIKVPEDLTTLPLVQPGDHTTMLAKYHTVWTTGGAGFVQTAAAQGCVVKVYGRTLDRNYRCPDDAGQKVQPGASPHLYALTLCWVDWRLALFASFQSCRTFWYALKWFWAHRVLLIAWNALVLANGCWSGPGRGFVLDPFVSAALFLMPVGMPFVLSVAFAMGTKEIIINLKKLGVISYRRLAWSLFLQTCRSMSYRSFSVWLSLFGVGPALVCTPLLSNVTTSLLLCVIRTMAVLPQEVKEISTQNEATGRYVLGVRPLLVGVLPVFHLQLVDTEQRVVYEGTFGQGAGAGDEFTSSHRPWSGMERCTKYFPVAVDPETFSALPRETGPYSLFWNCQNVVRKAVAKRGVNIAITTWIVVYGVSAYSIVIGTLAWALFSACMSVILLPRTLGGVDMTELTDYLAPYYGFGQPNLILVTAGIWRAVDNLSLKAWQLYSGMGASGDNSDVDDLVSALDADSDPEEEDTPASSSSESGSSSSDAGFESLPSDEGEKEGSQDNEQITVEGLEAEVLLRRAFSGYTPMAMGTPPVHNIYVGLHTRALDQGEDRLAFELSRLYTSREVLTLFGLVTSDVIQAAIDRTEDIKRRFGELSIVWREWKTHGAHKACEPLGQLHRQVAEALESNARKTLERGPSASCMELIIEQLSWEDGPPSIPVLSDYLKTKGDEVRSTVAPHEYNMWNRVAHRMVTYPMRALNEVQDIGRALTQIEQTDKMFAALSKEAPRLTFPTQVERVKFLEGWEPWVTPTVLQDIAYLTHIPGTISDKWLAAWFANHYDSEKAEVVDYSSDGEILALCARLAATAIEAGADETHAHEAALATCASLIEATHYEITDDEMRRLAFAEALFLEFRSLKTSPVQRTYNEVVMYVRRVCYGHSVSRKILACFLTIGEALGDGVDQLLTETIFLLQDHIQGADAGITVDISITLGKLMAQLLCITTALRRVPPKVVWAPLFKRKVVPITQAEKLLAAVRSPEPSAPIREPAKALVKRLQKSWHGKGPVPGLLEVYVRPVYRPQVAVGTTMEFEGIVDPPEIEEDLILDERVRGYLQMGVPQGIDGVWAYTDEKGHSSLSRYGVTRPSKNEATSVLVEQAVSALVEHDPDSYLMMELTTPETVARYIEKKYSPGVPFIGTYRSRKELYRTGWMDAIMEETKRVLRTGDYPAMHFHAFPKMQVVDKEKLLAGKPIRTVVAQDPLNYFIDQVLMLERNKRAPSFKSGSAIGARLNEPGVTQYFRAVLERKRFFKADVTEFDANIPAEIHDGLAQLAALGYSNEPNRDALARVFVHRYRRLENGIIHLLSDGSQIPKHSGGATGQSATSWDDTHAMKLQAIVAWMFVTGRMASEFFTTNTFVNQGDDNLWGTDDNLDPQELAYAYKVLFNQTLKIESDNDTMTANFLGRLVRPGNLYEEDYALLGVDTPDLAVIQDTSQLLMRRSALTTLVQGLPRDKHLERRVMRSIGHASLMAHNRPMYDQMAKEWMEDAQSYLGADIACAPFDIEVDSDGHVMKATLRADYQPSSRRHANKIRFLNKAGRLPSYLEVLTVHLAPDSQERREARSRKLRAMGPKITVLEWSHQVLSGLVTVISCVAPAYLVKIAPEPTTKPPPSVFTFLDFKVEMFIFRRFEEEHRTRPTDGEFRSLCKECPYRDCLDPMGFLWWFDIPQNRNRYRQLSTKILRNYCYTITVSYVLIRALFGKLQDYRVIGRIIEFIFFAQVDLPRLYSVMNLIYWHSEARSSSAISGLMPTDPYKWSKRFARMATSLVPDRVLGVIPTNAIAMLAPAVATGIARARTWDPFAAAKQRAAESLNNGNPWDRIVKDLFSSFGTASEYHYLSSPTATGKSTLFVAAILNYDPNIKVWLVLPRVVNRREYSNPFTNEHYVRLERNITTTDERLVVSTYGQLIARLGTLDSAKYLFLLDEIHEGTPEMVTIYVKTQGMRRLLMTATPRPELYPAAHRMYVTGLPRPHTLTIRTIDLPPLGLFQELVKQHPEAGARALVLTPGIREAETVSEAIKQLGHYSTVLSRNNRSVAVAGVICATQVADSGLNIRPGVNFGVSSGRMVASSRGRVVLQYSSPATKVQRAGRIGRDAPGHFYAPPHAGTGPEPVHYPSWTLYTGTAGMKATFDRLFNLMVSMTPIDGARKVLPTSDLTYFRDVIFSQLSPEEFIALVPSLSIYYLMVSTTGDARAARDAYVRLKNMGVYDEALAPVEAIIKDFVRAGRLNPFPSIFIWLEALPFVTRINGNEIPHAGLRLEGLDAVVVRNERM